MSKWMDEMKEWHFWREIFRLTVKNQLESQRLAIGAALSGLAQSLHIAVDSKDVTSFHYTVEAEMFTGNLVHSFCVLSKITNF